MFDNDAEHPNQNNESVEQNITRQHAIDRTDSPDQRPIDTSGGTTAMDHQHAAAAPLATNSPPVSDEIADVKSPAIDSDGSPSIISKDGPQLQKFGEKISVAVIGDIGTDWSFISRLPSRPSGEMKYPWTQHPAIHLFAIPGGAWFSGHMIQGALSSPIFDRRYWASIASPLDQSSTMVTVVGNLDWSPHLRETDSNAFTITVTLLDLNLGEAGRPVLILDDATSVVSTNISAVEIRIPWGQRSVSSSHIELGVVDATLLFEREDNHLPGQISADPVGRCYYYRNMQIQPQKRMRKGGLGFDCTHLTLQNLPCKVYTTSTSGEVIDHGTVRSVRIVNDAIRRGEPSDERTIQVKTNACHSSLFLGGGTIDVSYGQLAITAWTTDRGKLNSPSSLVDIPAVASSANNEEFPGHLATEDLTASVIDDAHENGGNANNSSANSKDGPLGVIMTYCDSDEWAFPGSERRVPIEKQLRINLNPLGGRYALWFYKNPGPRISMQHPAHVVHTLSEIGPRHRTDSSMDGRVYRRVEMQGVDGPRHGYPTILDHYNHSPTVIVRPNRKESGSCTRPVWAEELGKKVVVVDDLGYGFCGRSDHWAPFLCPEHHSQTLRKHSLLGSRAPDDVISDCAKHLSSTWIIIKCSHWLNADVVTLLKFLEQCNAQDRTIIVVSGESLRTGFITSRERPGIRLSKTVSWERTCDDFRSALCEGKLQSLTVAKHLIVRLGVEGAILWERDSPNVIADAEQCVLPDISGKMTLFFDGERIEGEYAPTEQFGEFPGLTTVLVAALSQKLVRLASEHVEFERLVSKELHVAVKFGMRCVRRYFDLGYGPTPETVRKFERLQLPITQIFGYAPIQGCRENGSCVFHEFSMVVRSKANVGALDLTPSAPSDKGDEGWSILSRQLDASSSREIGLSMWQGLLTPDQAAAVARGITALTLARDIVVSGAKAAMKRSDLEFPYARFGDLLAVDRREIEGFRAIRNLFSEYIGHTERKAPLSIAVFGPPGSGKSFGVQQIARQVASQSGIKELVFNLAQFTSYQDVSRLLLQVRDAALDDCLPLVFFDEFDSTLNSQQLGWLRYFLSPMQDGRFQHDGSMLGIGKAIFVFAGGIASTHSDFISNAFWKERASNGAHGDIFAAAKGLDFHSRLRGYLEIVGPNSGSGNLGKPKESVVSNSERVEKEDFSYVVRRALLVRQHIEKMAKAEPTILDAQNCADVDRDVLDAFLLVEEYKHGVRSLQAIVEMSALHGARTFSKTSLPSPEQSLMHVDESFTSLLRRSHSKLTSIILRAICAQPHSLKVGGDLDERYS